MEIIEKILNNNIYTFVCETWKTSKAWGHKVTMLRNNTTYNNQKITYYNRTWESYRYRTCITKCIEATIEKEFKFAIKTHKENTNKKRLSQTEKDEIKNNSCIIRELKELRELV